MTPVPVTGEAPEPFDASGTGGGQGAVGERAGGTVWHGDDGRSSRRGVIPVVSGAGRSSGDGAGITPAIRASSAAKSPSSTWRRDPRPARGSRSSAPGRPGWRSAAGSRGASGEGGQGGKGPRPPAAAPPDPEVRAASRPTAGRGRRPNRTTRRRGRSRGGGEDPADGRRCLVDLLDLHDVACLRRDDHHPFSGVDPDVVDRRAEGDEVAGDGLSQAGDPSPARAWSAETRGRSYRAARTRTGRDPSSRSPTGLPPHT